jgi:hypothetical protein
MFYDLGGDVLVFVEGVILHDTLEGKEKRKEGL